MSTDQYRAMILRGDSSYTAPNYTINGGQYVTTFVEFGGTYRFRQVTNLVTSLVFEITPTHVSIPTSLRVGGYTAGIRPFLSCAVTGGIGGVYWTRGQIAANCTRRGTGEYTVTWGTVAHPDGAQCVPQYCLLNAFGSICGGTRTSTSMEIRTASDGVGTIADRDFWFTLH
jgi:hypothetical protein